MKILTLFIIRICDNMPIEAFITLGFQNLCSYYFIIIY